MIPIKLYSTALLLLCALAFSGCYDFERKITWSADGETMAVIGEDGLRLCAVDGKFSDVLVKNARLAEWIEVDGEQKLVVHRYRSMDSWQAIEAVLADPVREAVIAEAEKLVAEMRADGQWGRLFGKLFGENSDWTSKDQWDQAMKLYIVVQLSDNELVTVADDFDFDLSTLEAYVGEVVVYSQGSGLVLGEAESVSRAFIGSIDELRISPTQQHAAFVVEAGNSSSGLWVVSLSGAAADAEAPSEFRVDAGMVGVFPDWTVDGRAIVYTRPDRTDQADSGEDVSIGYLVRRQIFDEGGDVLEEMTEERLAWLLFYGYGRVRCLSDGRILVTAIDAHFPMTEADVPQSDQLYLFDPSRSATLTRVIPAQTLANLPDLMALYEVSPDGRKIVVMDSQMSQVSVVDLATGEFYSLQDEDLSDVAWMPSWTPDGQLCFRGRLPESENQEENPTKESVEVLLWDGENSKAISKGWPKDLRRSLDLGESAAEVK
jgi:hypothetical protein